MNDFNEVVIFTQVVQEMSFTRAAGALQISKAAVSRAIASLEERLKTRLFERTTRRLRLTEAGQTFLCYAKRAVEETQQGEAAVSRLTERPRGTLRVVLPVTLAQSSVALKLARFLKAYPEMTLDLQLKGGQTDPIAQHVDVVFQTARPVRDSQLIQRRLVTVQMGLYAGPQYLASAPPLRFPQDLAHHSCLTMADTPDGKKWRLMKDNKPCEVRVGSRVSVGDPIIHHRMCVDGAGVAILPNWVITDEVSKRRLQRVLPEYMPSPIELYVIYPSRLSMTPKLKVFVNFIKSVVPGA